MSGKTWTDCDSATRAFVLEFVSLLRSLLADNLTSVILHGSLAFGCYYMNRSDIDVLAVAEVPLAEEDARNVLRALCKLNDARPHTGALEFNLLLAKDAHAPRHPIPSELHFDNDSAEKIRSDTFHYHKRRSLVHDIAWDFTVARVKGINLYGSKPETILAPVPCKDFLGAMMEGDLGWIINAENILIKPYHGVLNACRVLRTLEEGEDSIGGREDGALWALRQFPDTHHGVVLKALDIYRSASPVSSNSRQRRTGGVEWDRLELLAFRDYIREQISAINSAHFEI